MANVITFGEIMLRLSTPGNERIMQADQFDVCYGGGEANVAVSLAHYGYDVEFVTEFVKTWTYTDRKVNKYGQYYKERDSLH